VREPGAAVGAVPDVILLGSSDQHIARQTALLEDDTLQGEILADRYLYAPKRVTPADLIAWFERYRDHPEAGRIRALLAKLAPGSEATRGSQNFAANPEETFSAGLADWRSGDYAAAADRFETAWHDQNLRSGRRSAMAFWAARARLRDADLPGYLDWMARAADAGPDFYALLARHMLGAGRQPPASHDTLSEADAGGVLSTEAGYRAVALLEVGEVGAAQREFDQLWLLQGNNPQLRRAVELVARQAGLRDPGRNIASLVAPEAVTEQFPALAPRSGFAFDPALVYALVRTESNFKSRLVSREGARGLMQIMPVTARALARLGLVSGADRRNLYNAAVNLDVGQRYLTYLDSQQSIHGDLIRVLASYNAGVGGFNRWNQNITGGSDPLLYIEEIPNRETRGFVLKVFGYAWIYAERINEAEPGIDEFAAGAFPRLSGQ